MQLGGNCLERLGRSDKNYLLGNKNQGVFSACPPTHFLFSLGGQSFPAPPPSTFINISKAVPGTVSPLSGSRRELISDWSATFYLQNLFPNSPHFRTPGVQAPSRSSGDLHLPDLLSLQLSALPASLVPAATGNRRTLASRAQSSSPPPPSPSLRRFPALAGTVCPDHNKLPRARFPPFFF